MSISMLRGGAPYSQFTFRDSSHPSLAAIPHRRPVLAKLRTSLIKRRLQLMRSLARARGRSAAPMTGEYFGANFVLLPSEAIDEEIAIKRYEWWQLTMLLKACRHYRPEVFIDVGANIGLYTCVLGRARAVRRLLAFEPDSENFARLSDHVARNGLAGAVDARPLAVGAAKGTASLIPGSAENSGLAKLGDAGREHALSVELVALDDELDVRNGVICIKIDVEGYECEVLAGAVNLFRSNGGYAQIECHDGSAAEITRTMHDSGWQLIGQHDLNLVFVRDY